MPIITRDGEGGRKDGPKGEDKGEVRGCKVDQGRTKEHPPHYRVRTKGEKKDFFEMARPKKKEEFPLILFYQRLTSGGGKKDNNDSSKRARNPKEKKLPHNSILPSRQEEESR